jgi:hypothetical protein
MITMGWPLRHPNFNMEVKQMAEVENWYQKMYEVQEKLKMGNQANFFL